MDKGKDEVEDKKELYYILNRLLSYPSTELAETHQSANRLGQFDINSEERYRRITDIVHLPNQEIRELGGTHSDLQVLRVHRSGKRSKCL